MTYIYICPKLSFIVYQNSKGLSQIYTVPPILFFLACRPSAGHGSSFLSFVDHTQRVISSSQWLASDETQRSQQTDIHAPGVIRTHSPSKRAAAELPLRSRGQWHRLQAIVPLIFL